MAKGFRELKKNTKKIIAVKKKPKLKTIKGNYKPGVWMHDPDAFIE